MDDKIVAIMFGKYRKFFVITTIFMAAFLILPSISFANLQITEIMYDVEGTDTGREWIEIFNSGNDVLDITKFKLYEANTNHGIVAVDGGIALNGSEYAVIADNPTKFKIDFPNYSGKLFDSVFSLSNEGESLSLKNESSTIVDSISYDPSLGANGDGKSLQKIANVWQPAAPTPGAENIVSNNDVGTSTSTSTDESIASSTSTSTATTTLSDNNSNSNTQIIVRTVTKYISAHSNPEELSSYEENSPLEISAGRERIAYVGAPIKFSAKYKIPKNINDISNFTWSYGDGTKSVGEETSHVYKFPGDYTVVLNGSFGGKKAVSRTTVKVLSPQLSVSFVFSGDLEIANLGKTEINLGDWKIRNSAGDFVFPEDTIISSGEKMILSKEYSKIFPDVNMGATVFDPSGNFIARTNFLVNKKDNNLTNTSSGESTSTSQISVITPLIEITQEKVESFIKEYKKIAIQNKPIKAEIFPVHESSTTAATNLEAEPPKVDTSSTDGLLKKVFNLPVSGIKAAAKIFYDIE